MCVCVGRRIREGRDKRKEKIIQWTSTSEKDKVDVWDQTAGICQHRIF